MSAQPKYTHTLKGARAIIFGGSSGIGEAVAEALIEEGASVLISSSKQQKLDQVVARLGDPSQVYNADPSRIAGAVADLSDGPTAEAALEALFSKSLPPSWQGKVDHIIFTAGDRLWNKPLEEHSYADILQAGQVRFFAPLLVAKIAVKYWAQNGTLTLTAGIVARQPRYQWSVINSFATGLEGMTRGLALDLAATNDLRVRVNCVHPGPVLTPIWNEFPEEMRKAVIEKTEKDCLVKFFPGPECIAHTYSKSRCKDEIRSLELTRVRS